MSGSRHTTITVESGGLSISTSSSSLSDDEGDQDYAPSSHAGHEGDDSWEDQYDDEIEPSDSASASQEYKPPARPHTTRRHASRHHRIPHPRQSSAHQRAPPGPPMTDETSEEFGPSAYGRGFAPAPPPAPPGFFPRGGPPGYPQSHVGGFMGPNHYNSQMVPYLQNTNPFAPMGGMQNGGANYFPDARGPYDMMPYHGGNQFFNGGNPYGVPPHMQQFMYSQVPPPPPTELGVPDRPTPAPEKRSDPELEKMKAQLELYHAEEKKKKEAEKQKEAEERIKKDTEEAFRRRLEEMRLAQEEARLEIEKARKEAEAAARERIEAERKAEEERRRQYEENLKRAEREAKEKLEAEFKAAEERRAKEAEAAKAAEAAARAKIEAAMKAEAEAKAAAEKKAAEELEWRKRLEEEAKVKAEIEARKQLEAEKKAAEEEAQRQKEEAEWRKNLEEEAKRKAELEARTKLEKEQQEAADKKAAEEAKKKADDALKKQLLEEAKAKAEELAKKKEKPPIKFKDAVGRKFSFPFHLCQTWQGMEDLIKQAFLHVDVIGPHVQEGHFDLVGPNGEIILPQVWDKVIEPDWSITMHMWPMDKAPLRNQMPFRPPMGGGAPHMDPRGPPFRDAHPRFSHIPGARPPGARPPGVHPGSIPMPPGPPINPIGRPMVVSVEPHRKRGGSSKPSNGGGFLSWIGGKPVKKKKPHK